MSGACPEAGAVAGIRGTRAAQVWRFDPAVAALSSASVGGGRQTIDWLVNIGVSADYDRHDLDRHRDEVVAHLELVGTGVALFTAVDVHEATTAWDESVRADATVGVTRPTWAADADQAVSAVPVPGTINVVVQVPVALDPGAAVNAVITATEAKTQALAEHGIPGTGTASDAVAICWPATGPAERFGGPRSPWGARIARAVHGAVAAGLAGGNRTR